MKLFFVTLTALMLVACGPLPRPFIDQEPQNNPLLKLSGTRPLAVERPTITLPVVNNPELVLWAQETLSTDMQEQGLPAAHYAFTENSLQIHSSFTTLPKTATQSLLTLEIRVTEAADLTEVATGVPLQAPTGALSETIIQIKEQTTAPTSVLSSNPKPLLSALILRASEKLNHAILGLNEIETEQPPSEPSILLTLLPLPDILVKPSQKILTNELQTSLLLRGYKLTDDNQAVGHYKLKFEIAPEQKGENYFLTLRWILLDYAANTEIGVIEQTNSVPNIPLSRIISPASEAIAEGVATGIDDLLQQKSLQNQTVLK